MLADWAVNEFSEAIDTAWALIRSGDPVLVEIVARSLQVSLSAVFCAGLVGLPLGACLALQPFPGRQILLVVLNAAMGLPPVVVGLLLYLLLSRAGPFGFLGLLFSASAMVLAQTLIVLPIVAALSRQILANLWEEYRESLQSLGASGWQALGTLLWEGRFRLLTVLMAGFGRAMAEVGAVLIVGGNIAHVTRVMTTTIALETSKGNLALALALGLILIVLALVVNGAVFLMQESGKQSVDDN